MPPHATNPTTLLWRDEDRLGQTLNSTNTKGNTESTSGGRWDQGQAKGSRKHHNFTRDAARLSLKTTAIHSIATVWLESYRTLIDSSLKYISSPVPFLNPCVKSLDSVLQNGNALPIEGTLEVTVISPFLREGLRRCRSLCRDLRSLNPVLPRRNIRNNTFCSEKGRQFLSTPQIYRSDFSTTPLIELAIPSSPLLSPQIWHNSDSRSNPPKVMNAVLKSSQIKVY